jgi:hypothetical protein
MNDPRLFPITRACCVCGTEARPASRHSHDGPSILAVSSLLYRRGTGKGTLKGAKRVQICEPCFARVLAPSGIFGGKEAKLFLAALRESLQNCYSAMLEGDRA